ncbi:MAG: hypothetical protein AAB638_02860 [Patescibacteria group bacterium]
MKKIIVWLQRLISLIIRLVKKPKTWLIYNLGLTLPKPPLRPQDESPFGIEEPEEPKPIRTRERINCYRYYSEFLTFLASEVIDKNIPIGSTFHIPRKVYIEHHLESNPGANPRSFYNGPIARELRSHQYFERRGIKFEQCNVEITKDEYGYKVGEKFFELKRIR